MLMWNYVYPSHELYHHGILGQRWGKKNGPPYPIAAGAHSASEKKAGWKKSLNSSNVYDRRAGKHGIKMLKYYDKHQDYGIKGDEKKSDKYWEKSKKHREKMFSNKAKSYQSELNKLDQKMAKHEIARDKFLEKGYRLLEKNKGANAEKKASKFLNKAHINKESIKQAERKMHETIKEMKEFGYGFNTNTTERYSRRGRKIVAGTLESIGTLSIIGGISSANPLLAGAGSLGVGAGSFMLSRRSVQGNKFSVKRGARTGKVRKHEQNYTVYDEDELRNLRNRIKRGK